MQTFGGSWTDEKLDSVRRYLEAWATALKQKPKPDRPFRRIYIDAFAGSGEWASPRDGETSLFADMEKLAEIKQGSPALALGIEPPFDCYYFIEKNPSQFRALCTLAEKFPHLAGRMQFLQEDANSAVKRICENENWKASRAVMFLDPFAMQVDWSTIEAINRTRAIDLWYLFPFGALLRNMPKSGKPNATWQPTIAKLLGDDNWLDAHYTQTAEPDLFSGEVFRQNRTADVEAVKSAVLSRFRSTFPYVAPNPLVLTQNKNSPLFLLFFACSNPSNVAGPIALKIATYILDKKRRG